MGDEVALKAHGGAFVSLKQLSDFVAALEAATAAPAPLSGAARETAVRLLKDDMFMDKVQSALVARCAGSARAEPALRHAAAFVAVADKLARTARSTSRKRCKVAAGLKGLVYEFQSYGVVGAAARGFPPPALGAAAPPAAAPSLGAAAPPAAAPPLAPRFQGGYGGYGGFGCFGDGSAPADDVDARAVLAPVAAAALAQHGVGVEGVDVPPAGDVAARAPALEPPGSAPEDDVDPPGDGSASEHDGNPPGGVDPPGGDDQPGGDDDESAVADEPPAVVVLRARAHVIEELARAPAGEHEVDRLRTSHRARTVPSSSEDPPSKNQPKRCRFDQSLTKRRRRGAACRNRGPHLTFQRFFIMSRALPAKKMPGPAM